MTTPATLPTLSALLDDLQARTLVHQHTPGLAEHLKAPRTLYCGFDPSAESLHVGSLMPLLTLRRFALAGHTVIVLMGGATGMIGDPSFKATERKLLDDATLAKNVAGVEAQVKALFGDLRDRVTVMNNAEWTKGVGVLEFLRDIGKHYSVNQMIARDSVRTRLERDGEGISFTEFAYALLQGFDFYHLYKTHGCTLQTGASDQWGNMTAGTELIRKKAQGEAHVLTLPLIVKADGTKYGKSESGAVWLDAKLTSPYAFYQFWLNTSDADVERFLRYFSFTPLADIEALCAQHHADPGKRQAQTALAAELTALLHGAAALAAAQRISEVLFGGDVAALTEADFEQLAAGGLPVAQLEAGGSLADALVQVGLAASKREAREFMAGGAVQHNGVVVKDDGPLTDAAAAFGRYHLLKRGKRLFGLVMAA